MNRLSKLAQLAAVILPLFIAHPALAAVYTVSNSAELIAALNDANVTPAIDIIELSDDVVLNAVDNIGQGPNGLPVVVTPVLVMGNGHSITRDPGAPLFRMFEVRGGFLGDGELTLDRLTLAGGDATPVAAGPPASPCFADLSVCGGAALVASGALTLRNGATIVNNQAYMGGGLFNAFGRITVEDSTLTGNSAEFGGAIASQGTLGVAGLTIGRSTLGGNEAVASGGAIYNRSAMDITDSTFESNRVTVGSIGFGGGGAIENTSFTGQADIATSVFTGNEAPRGGAILNFNAADLTLRNSEVVANSIVGFGDGGGIFNGGSGAAVIIRDSRVNDNSASQGLGKGGGIYSDEGGLLTLENSEVQNNVAASHGGGAVILAGRVVNSRIENNTGGGDGGGIYHEGLKALEIVASSIANNAARREGGGLATYSPFAIVPDGITIEDSTISGNSAEEGGGVANMERGLVTIRRSLIANNIAEGLAFGGGGGGVFSNSSGQTTILDSTIANNTARSGGGVYNSNFSLMNIDHSTVTSNSSSGVGGGAVAFAPIAVTDSLIAHNIGGSGSPNCVDFGTIVDNGGNYTDDRGAALSCPATFVETTALNLGPLADNGGPTQTIAPGAGSPALAGGTICQTPTDQRGVPRQLPCNSGAYEGDVVMPVLNFELAASTVNESPGGAHQVYLELDNSAGTITEGRVEAYLVIDGQAAPGDRDYTVTVGPPIVFDNNDWPAPGTSSSQTVELDVLPDFLLEGDETIRLALRDGGFVGPTRLGGERTHVVTIVDALADLEVSKWASTSGPVFPGDTVTFTIEVSNNGPTDAANVSVYDPVDGAAFDLVNSTVAASAGVFDPTTGDWSLDGLLQGQGFALPAGETETMTITAELRETASDTVTNLAQISRYFPPLAADPDPANDSDSVSVDVCDATPPALEVELVPNLLWPPNHRLVDIVATVTASDNSGQEPEVTLVSVTSNEPDNGLGDGDTATDIFVEDETNFALRAERAGLGAGRIYTVTYQATDNCGNITESSAKVMVPKSQGGR